jgi:hypothetical protein
MADATAAVAAGFGGTDTDAATNHAAAEQLGEQVAAIAAPELVLGRSVDREVTKDSAAKAVAAARLAVDDAPIDRQPAGGEEGGRAAHADRALWDRSVELRIGRAFVPPGGAGAPDHQ